MKDIEKRALEMLAEGIVSEWPDNHDPRMFIEDLMEGDLNRIRVSASVVVKVIAAALTPPEGYVLVPGESTEEMVNAASDAYMPFGDMGLAIQAAISARPEANVCDDSLRDSTIAAATGGVRWTQ